MLDAPDAAFGGRGWDVCWPGRELFGDGAEVRPGACAGAGCGMCGGVDERGEFWGRRWDDRGNDDEAVFLEGLEI